MNASRFSRFATSLALTGFGLLAAQSLSAGLIGWTDWTSFSGGLNGTATGNIIGTGITVSYTGDVDASRTQTGAGINYWTEQTPAPYTGNAVIDNAPVAAEMIALSRAGSSNTITFSQPVLNPVMTIVSQGQNNLPVSYTFNTAFSLLSEGDGYWSGTYVGPDATIVGNTLTGNELHGAIQFSGTFTSISWTVDNAEFWHGITFGVPIPEPSAALSLITGLALIGLIGRRRRNA